MRDLVRAREDAVGVGTQAKYRLKAFLLRQGRRYRGREGWTLPYRRWLTDLSFPSAPQHIALQEYRDAIDETERRIDRLTEQLRQLAPTWRWAPVVAALQALRGVSFLTAVALAAELGDLTRFGHPRELMAYLGLVPSEYSSGPTVCRGGITKAGNPHVRRLLAEAAWAYQGIPRIGRQHADKKRCRRSCPILRGRRSCDQPDASVASSRAGKRNRRWRPRSRASSRASSGPLLARSDPRRADTAPQDVLVPTSSRRHGDQAENPR